MNKKPIYWTAAVLMVLSFAYGTLDWFVTSRQTDYVITLLTSIDVFVARPIFYTCLALVFGLKIIAPCRRPWLRITCLIMAVSLLLLLAGVALAAILNVEFTLFFFAFIRYLFKYNVFFLLPGILLAVGINKE